jgi:histidine triad (HIT) family protein
MTEEANDVDLNCLFCKIVAGQIPSTKVAESDAAFAFRDLNPTAPTHVLVVPKRHIANAGEITADHGDDLAAVMLLAQEVSRLEGLDARGYRLVFNVGEDSGNSVAHLHMHVVGGKPMGWPPFAK